MFRSFQISHSSINTIKLHTFVFFFFCLKTKYYIKFWKSKFDLVLHLGSTKFIIANLVIKIRLTFHNHETNVLYFLHDCSNVETILSLTCHVYGPFEFRTSFGISILLLLLIKNVHVNAKPRYNICSSSSFVTSNKSFSTLLHVQLSLVNFTILANFHRSASVRIHVSKIKKITSFRRE